MSAQGAPQARRRRRARRAPHPGGRRWPALAAALAVGAGLVGAAPGAALAATAPGSGPTAGGTVVSGALPTGVTFAGAPVTGSTHTVALGSDGHAYAWGKNTYGQLGDGTTTGSSLPVQVPTPAGVTFTAVAAGQYHTVALGSDGRAYAWGRNNRGQLGNTSTTNSSTAVVAWLNGVRLTDVAAGPNYTMARGSDGRTYAWGDNGRGQLGNGQPNDRPMPTPVTTPPGVTFLEVAGGPDHAVALGSDGHAYAWGDNDHGKLGDGTLTDSRVPVRVAAPAGVAFTAVAAGPYHTVAVGADGHTYAWGNNYYGQLGTGNSPYGSSRVPVQVQVPTGVRFTAVAASYSTTVALGSDGLVYAWGQNYYGQLGTGTTTPQSLPVRVATPAGVSFTAVDAMYGHVTALGSDGRTYAWGNNRDGQLGDGTTTDAWEPTAAPSPDVRVTSVAFGGVPATDLTQSGGTWQATTPAGCGPVDVSVEYEQYGTTRTETHPDGHTYGTAPTVVTDPGPATLPTGGQVTLAATATGDDTPTARWQHHDPTGWSDLPGATTTTLDVTTPGEYRAVFTNCRGEATTTTALVSPATADLTATTLTAAPGRVTTGEPATATVHLRDTTGTPLPGQSLTLHLDHPTLATAGPVTDHGDGTYTTPLTTLAPGTLALTVAVNGTHAPATATLHIDPTPDPGPGPGGSPDPAPGPGDGTGTGTGTTGTGTATTTRPGAHDRLAVTGAAVLAAMIAALSATALGTVLVHRRRTAD